MREECEDGARSPGGGELGALIRSTDWTATPLGPLSAWPPMLQTTLRLMLTAADPMLLWWGDDLVQLYNDACADTLGPEFHPVALGTPATEFWAGLWPIIGPQVEAVRRTGCASAHENQKMPVAPHRLLRDHYWTYSFNPIADADGAIVGVLAILRDVTREQRSAAALREREAELARVQEIGQIGGLEVDLQTGFRNRRSPEYLKVHGLGPDSANETHEDWVARVHPDDRLAVEKAFRHAVASNVREYGIRYRIIRPSDGRTRWISVKAAIERDAGGRAVRLIGAHTDITDQVLAERAVRDSEEQLRALANSLPHHIWTATADGRLDWVNPRVLDYFGATGPAAGQGLDWTATVHRHDRERVRATWGKAVAEGQPYETEFRLRRYDGEFRWFLSRAVPSHDHAGVLRRWIGSNTDIHDQRLLADQLADLNATLAQRVEEKTRERDRIWNVSQDLLLVADLDRVWRTVNPAWTRTLGWTEDDLLGRTSQWMHHPDDRTAALLNGDTLVAPGDTVRFETRLRHRDGTYRWLSWIAVRDDSSIYAVARDVTAEKLATERLQDTEDALRQAQKMEAVGQLTGGIAHDFNNLLTGIVGSLDLMATRLAQGRSDNVARYIDAAMASAQRAASLTHRLLAFARRQPLVPKPTDANALVGSLEDLLRRTIGEAIDLRIDAADGLWATLCDPNQLESALLNLAINARDAMPDGGRLAIVTQNIGAGPAVPNPLAAGDYIRISVADTGLGMTPEVLARAFDPFFTTKPIGQGTGLGLSMIYGFARQSNGHVEIESALARGTAVHLYLPRFRGVVAPAAAAPPPVHGAAARGETVLVVEDEEVVRNVVMETLTERGYRVLVARDGPQALLLLAAESAIDLLVTDVGLPGMNGRVLADRARAARPGLKVLFITGYAENVAMSEGFLEDGMAMMTKPFDLGALSRQVADLLALEPVAASVA